MTRVTTISRVWLLLLMAVAALALAVSGIGRADAGSNHGGGHTPVVVCHNVTHNPHIIVVDSNSIELKGHLKHRTQPQLMDLVEGYDGTAAQIRAACVKHETPPPTTTTDTGGTPSTTTSSTTTSSTSTTSSSPPPTTSTTSTSSTSTATSSTSSTSPATHPSAPSTATKPPSSSKASGMSAPKVPMRPRTVSPVSTSATAGIRATSQLAFTGAATVAYVVAGIVLILFGIWFLLIRRRTRQH